MNKLKLIGTDGRFGDHLICVSGKNQLTQLTYTELAIPNNKISKSSHVEKREARRDAEAMDT